MFGPESPIGGPIEEVAKEFVAGASEGLRGSTQPHAKEGGMVARVVKKGAKVVKDVAVEVIAPLKD